MGPALAMQVVDANPDWEAGDIIGQEGHCWLGSLLGGLAPDTGD
jgi:hypothetical protein